MRRKSELLSGKVKAGHLALLTQLGLTHYSYYAWGGMFSERGYTAVEIDIEAPKESASTRDSLQAMAKGKRLVCA